MADKNSYTIFWFRRDLRLQDNHGLYRALAFNEPVIPLFIYDTDIIDDLPKNDPRLGFITHLLQEIKNDINTNDSDIILRQGRPIEVWKKLIKELKVERVIWNHDYEPYAKNRDAEISDFLRSNGIEVESFKDQVIFEKSEVVKDDGAPYTVYTPYSKKWLEHYEKESPKPYPSEKNLNNLWTPSSELKRNQDLLEEHKTAFNLQSPNFSPNHLKDYEDDRNFPAKSATSGLSPYLRFGSIGIRSLMEKLKSAPIQFKQEIIWREFFMQILDHFPHVVSQSFKKEYDGIVWENDEEKFAAWKEGRTGFPMVDAGMRELNSTGNMHNRVRMVTASFLVKHLLIDWRLGEAYFAHKLMDYDLAANNGNWQWAAGCGCDAAPYFRIFNPTTQQEKFDPQFQYIKKWIPEFGTDKYPGPIIDHKFARQRALDRYKAALSSKS